MIVWVGSMEDKCGRGLNLGQMVYVYICMSVQYAHILTHQTAYDCYWMLAMWQLN